MLVYDRWYDEVLDIEFGKKSAVGLIYIYSLVVHQPDKKFVVRQNIVDFHLFDFLSFSGSWGPVGADRLCRKYLPRADLVIIGKNSLLFCRSDPRPVASIKRQISSHAFHWQSRINQWDLMLRLASESFCFELAPFDGQKTTGKTVSSEVVNTTM